MADELDIWPLVLKTLADGKHVALPRFVPELSAYLPFSIQNASKDLTVGNFGIPEPADHCHPASIKQLDLALVPGVGFDTVGRRLGRGKGFYDRMLPQISGVKCGTAFDFQMVAEIP